MIRNLKVLGLALAAVFAMSAVVASSAFAVTDTLTLEGSPTTLTGAQEPGAGQNKFAVGGQTVQCTTATFHATVTGTAVTSIPGITPNYGGALSCTYGANPLTVHVNGCTYTLGGLTDANGDAETKIVCPAGAHITLTIPAIKCEITIIKAGSGSQTATKGVHYTNVGAGATREVTIDLTAKVSVTSEEIPGSGGSAACTTLSGFPTGELTGSILVTGETEVTNAHTGIEIS